MNVGTLYRLGRRLTEISRIAAVDPGDPQMAAGELGVLADVLTHPGSSVKEITERTGFTQSHVSASVARLRGRGHVETVTDPSDRRRTLVRLTERASTAITRRALRPIDDAVGRAVENSDPRSADRVLAMLEELADRLVADGRGERGEDTVPDGVGRTAIGVARVRAEESRRPDRLFDDPYAEAFVAAAPGAFSEAEERGDLGSLGAAFGFHAVIRTRFFDDYLLAACAGGAGGAGVRQVVLLAAGLDTRAFRLAWPDGVRLFELDLPEVLTFKERVLAERGAVPGCARMVVPADLREDWATGLVEAGFQPAAPTAWLAEGLLIYLSADEAARLLTAVGELSAPDSQLAFERGDVAGSLLSRARATPAMERYASLWKGGLGEEAPDWLVRNGWQVRTHELAALAAPYGRPIRGESRSGFLTAVHRRLDQTEHDSVRWADER
ncbi:MAG: SAM-dependent methyltransferase [Streptosporangiales bacterium]|nr:SAM-dependent methyltransferase [Streptosporangiales bacterium]